VRNKSENESKAEGRTTNDPQTRHRVHSATLSSSATIHYCIPARADDRPCIILVRFRVMKPCNATNQDNHVLSLHQSLTSYRDQSIRKHSYQPQNNHPDKILSFNQCYNLHSFILTENNIIIEMPQVNQALPIQESARHKPLRPTRHPSFKSLVKACLPFNWCSSLLARLTCIVDCGCGTRVCVVSGGIAQQNK